jgi:hypothetical protein
MARGLLMKTAELRGSVPEMSGRSHRRWLTGGLAAFCFLAAPAVAHASSIEGAMAFFAVPFVVLESIGIGLCWWLAKKYAPAAVFVFYLLAFNTLPVSSMSIAILADAFAWGELGWMTVLPVLVVLAAWAWALYVPVQVWKLRQEHRRAETARMFDDAALDDFEA